MEMLRYLFNFILHIDAHLITFVTLYGAGAYALLFLIIFCETGLIILPFLPGDALLFATGALSANTHNTFNIHIIFVLLLVASILGNSVNYFIGRWLGPKIFCSEHSFLFNKNYLKKAHTFYEEYGGKAIIIARFIPIIRTFVPFVAGMGYMKPRHFFFYNVIGAVLWIGGFLYVSYWFGNFPIIKQHFSVFAAAVIVISLCPPLIGLIKKTRRK